MRFNLKNMGIKMTNLRRSHLTLSLALTLTLPLIHSGAKAQDDSLKELLACDKIKKPDDKLECFNAVIEILKRQEEEKKRPTAESVDDNLLENRSVDRGTPKKSTFGFSAEELERRANRENPQRKTAPKEQVFTFSRQWRDAAGKYYFLMTNGQIWKEISGSHLIVPSKAKSIRIKKNAMGGYYAFIQGMNGRKGRVERVR
jgi:hypothetical protein